MDPYIGFPELTTAMRKPGQGNQVLMEPFDANHFLREPPPHPFGMWVVLENRVPFEIPKIVRQPYKKDPKKGSNLENSPFVEDKV